MWAYKGGWTQYTSVMTKPAHLDYLALGSTVLTCVRSLPAHDNSELRHQCLILWNMSVCREEEQRSVSGGAGNNI